MPPRLRFSRIGHREYLREIGFVGAGDEALDAVDDVEVAVANGIRAHRSRIGAGLGFGLREAASLLAANDRQEILLARFAFQCVEDRAHRRPEYVQISGGQGGGAGDLAPDHDLGHHAEAEPAELLRHVVEPQTEPFHLVAQPLRQLLLQLDVVDDLALQRNQFAIDEPADVFFQKPKFFRQLEIHFFLATRRVSGEASCIKTIARINCDRNRTMRRGRVAPRSA